MDLGFLAVYNYLKPFIEQDSIVYYKDKMILTDNTRMKAKFLSKELSDNNQSIVELKITNSDGTRIIDDYKINLKNKYICTIDDTIESVQIVDHYSNTINDIIKVKIPNYYDVEEIEEICLMPIALSRFSYGKFEMKDDSRAESTDKYPKSIIEFQKELHKTMFDYYRSKKDSVIERIINYYIFQLSHISVADYNATSGKTKMLLNLPKPKKRLFRKIISGKGNYNDYKLLNV